MARLCALTPLSQFLQLLIILFFFFFCVRHRGNSPVLNVVPGYLCDSWLERRQEQLHLVQEHSYRVAWESQSWLCRSRAPSPRTSAEVLSPLMGSHHGAVTETPHQASGRWAAASPRIRAVLKCSQGLPGAPCTEIAPEQCCRGTSAVLCGWEHLCRVSVQSLKGAVSSERYCSKQVSPARLYTSRKGHLYSLMRGLMFYLNTQVVSECCLALRVPDPLHPFY